MVVRDRLTRGFAAGLLGGIAMNITNLTSFYILNWTDVRFLDWAAVLLYGHRPANFLETAFALGGQLFFAGLVGIIFAHLLPKVTSGHYLLKGWIYGLFIWFSTFSLAIMFRLPTLATIGFDTASSTLIGASVYGLVLAEAMRRLDQKLKG